MKFPLGVKGLLLVLFFYINSSFAQTIYVDANAGGLNNGASWKNAYIDLQTALQLAVSGNDIWVKGGVYKPTSSNKRVTSFVMKEGVSLYGGFSGIETDINQRDRSTQTVLSGDIGNLSDSTDNSYHVLTINSISLDTITIDGFTIMHGAANIDSVNTSQGGGILFLGVNKVKLQNCVIKNNVAYNQGAGFFIKNGSPVFIACAVKNNSTNARTSANGGFNCATMGPDGGGGFNESGSPIFYNCTFQSNECGDRCSGTGSAFCNYQGNPKFINCNFTAHKADLLQQQYRFMYCNFNAASTFKNCLFNENSALAIYNSGELIMEACTFTKNSDGTIRCQDGSLSISKCNFLQNTVSCIDATNAANTSKITDCLFQNNISYYGAVRLQYSDILIDNCTFKGNEQPVKGHGTGGAILNYSANLTITNSTFIENKAGEGGAIYNGGTGVKATPIIRNCKFIRNEAAEGTLILQGADIKNAYPSDASIINCTFLGSVSGSSICNYSGTSTITGCIFSGAATTAVFNYEASPIITNCTFNSNGIYNIYNTWGSPAITNCLFNGKALFTKTGTPVITYSILSESFSGEGNINADANNILIDPDGLDGIVGTEDDNLRLKASSPAYNAGTPSTANLLLATTDLDGNARIFDNRIDIGAYEYSIGPAKKLQVITFPKIQDRIYSQDPLTLTASSNSGLPVTFVVVSGAASVIANMLTILSVGDITVKAVQNGNNMYAPANEVQQTFHVSRATQSISFEKIADHPWGGLPFDLFVTASSGLPVSINITAGDASMIGNKLNIIHAGHVTVVASQQGSNNYFPAADVSQTFEVNKIKQVINFEKIENKILGATPFALTASSTANLPISFSVVSGPAVINDNMVTINDAGKITIRASQGGSEDYLPAYEQQDFLVTVIAAVETAADKELKIYPNPASLWLHVEWRSTLEEVSFALIDIVGNKIFDGIISPDFRLDVSSLSKGTYFLLIKGSSVIVNRKIVIN